MTSAQKQAKEILDRISNRAFESCLPIDRNFRHFPELPGIYAIRHRIEGLLYNVKIPMER